MTSLLLNLRPNTFCWRGKTNFCSRKKNASRSVGSYSFRYSLVGVLSAIFISDGRNELKRKLRPAPWCGGTMWSQLMCKLEFFLAILTRANVAPCSTINTEKTAIRVARNPVYQHLLALRFSKMYQNRHDSVPLKERTKLRTAQTGFRVKGNVTRTYYSGSCSQY